MAKKAGFTLTELLVSIAILTLISSATVFTLGRTRQKQELSDAARVVEGDIRSAQSRAISGANILACETVDGPRNCEAGVISPDACTGPCVSTVPDLYGVLFYGASTTYAVVADISSLNGVAKAPPARVTLFSRDVNPLAGAAGSVSISDIGTSSGSVDHLLLSVARQSGTMKLSACVSPGDIGCALKPPFLLHLQLLHEKLQETETVDVDARVGRVSLPL